MNTYLIFFFIFISKMWKIKFDGKKCLKKCESFWWIFIQRYKYTHVWNVIRDFWKKGERIFNKYGNCFEIPVIFRPGLLANTNFSIKKNIRHNFSDATKYITLSKSANDKKITNSNSSEATTYTLYS